MVLQEANLEPFAGMVAVAGVALDRVRDNRWPDNAEAVVRQPNQFTGMSIKIRRYSQQQITRARLAVAAAEGGTRPCGRVLYYHTDWVKPKWDYSKIEVACQLGDHIFYRDNR
jgi:N-acetylmuramoyl-L-alanine amidase